MRVFVSYRRDDNALAAGRLRDRLVEVYAPGDVFFDVDDIPFGVDFREVIRAKLLDVDVVLAIIGRDWNLERLNSETDYVRAELHEALQQKKLLIPVLLGDTPMPQPDVLPDELKPFAYLNATHLRPDPDFATDAARLIDRLGREQGAASSATTRSKARDVRNPARLVVGIVVAVVVVLLAVAGIVTLRNDQGGQPRKVNPTQGSAGVGPVFTQGDNPVTVYSGPSDQKGAYQVKASLATASPVFLRCSLHGSPVGEHMNPLWYFVESEHDGSSPPGWVADHWLHTGTSVSVTPPCLGNIANPTVGSGVPNRSSGPYPVVVDAGTTLAVRNTPTPSSPSVATLSSGDIVVLKCSVAGNSVNPAPRGPAAPAANSAWDQIAQPISGWIPDSNVSSHSPTAVAPPC